MEMLFILIVGIILGALNSYYNDHKAKKYKPDSEYANLDIPIADKYESDFSQEKYDKYLLTEEWTTLKATRLMIDDFKCQQCDISITMKTSHCHHVSYIRLGNEKLSDLLSLCPSCHNKIHEYYGKNAKFYPLLQK